MSKKELLYKQLGALRLEVDSSIVDEIVATANAAFQEQLLQQAPCSTLREMIVQKLILIQKQEPAKTEWEKTWRAAQVSTIEDILLLMEDM